MSDLISAIALGPEPKKPQENKTVQLFLKLCVICGKKKRRDLRFEI